MAGSCWAFATFASLESYFKPGESLDLSENNLKNTLSNAYSEGFDYDEGGNMLMSTAYLARWSGPVAESEKDMRAQAERIIALGAKTVLIKGGHGSGNESVDLLVDVNGVIQLAAPRIATRNTHGTGCSLSSAIAAELAKGATLRDAVRTAKAFVTGAIEAADKLAIGHGRGPVHHFHKWW